MFVSILLQTRTRLISRVEFRAAANDYHLSMQHPSTNVIQINDNVQNNTIHNDASKDLIQTTYHSSDWEKLWLRNIQVWQEGAICDAIANQHEQVSAFMNDTCFARTDTPWCLLDDTVQQLWYHTISRRVHVSKMLDAKSKPRVIQNRPREIKEVFGLGSFRPHNRQIWSWFERKNILTGEVTFDYVEPLVGHLRHPLARCGPDGEAFAFDRSYLLPGVSGTQKTYLFDAGASSWFDGAGGPSLSYFAGVWKRFGFNWDAMECWEGKTAPGKFFASVPTEWQTKVEFHQQMISTHPSLHPFVPSVIRQKVSKNDYVVFKLDIDSKTVETSIVEYMLQWNDLEFIDEFIWEHHVKNYLMAPNWKKTQDMNMTIADSYDYFLRLRKRGVRAHSWV